MEATTSMGEGSTNEKVPNQKKYKLVRKAAAPRSRPYPIKNTHNYIEPVKREKLCKLDVLPEPMSTILDRAKLARAKADLERAKKADTTPKIESYLEYSLELQWWSGEAARPTFN